MLVLALTQIKTLSAQEFLPKNSYVLRVFIQKLLWVKSFYSKTCTKSFCSKTLMH